MKRLRVLIIAALLPVTGLARPTLKSGNWVGNGGDSSAMSIHSRIRELYAILKGLSPECSTDLALQSGLFAEILLELSVNTTPTPLYLKENGREVYKEAINYPDQVTIDFHREAYRLAPDPDQLIIHEVMGLARLPDPNGEESQKIATRLNSKVCRSDEPIEETAGGEFLPGDVPRWSEIDRKGIIYFRVTGRNMIYRYSAPAQKFLPPLKTRENLLTSAVSPKGDRIYLAYRDRRITYIDLRAAKPSTEKDFVTAELEVSGYIGERNVRIFESQQIRQLLVISNQIVVIPNSSSSLSVVSYNFAGQRAGQMNTMYSPYALASDVNGSGFFVVENLSPRTMERFPAGILEDFNPESKRWPYHGDFPVEGPIVASPVYIAIGSGYVVSNGKMELTAKLGRKFDRAAWIGATLYTGKDMPNGFRLEGLTAPDFAKVFEREQNNGALISLHSWKEQLIVVWVDAAGTVKIENVAK